MPGNSYNQKTNQNRKTGRMNSFRGRLQTGDDPRQAIARGGRGTQDTQTIITTGVIADRASPRPNKLGKRISSMAKAGFGGKGLGKYASRMAQGQRSQTKSTTQKGELPNLDDITEEFNGGEERQRRQMHYDDYYGTTYAKRNKLKEKYSRRSKK
jgi:hypothetical protein